MADSAAPAQRAPHVPPPLSPERIGRELSDALTLSADLARLYPWLYGSAYARGRSGDTERVRRDVSGVGGGLDGSYAAIEAVRRHIAQCSDDIRAATARLRSARTNLTRAEAAIDRQSGPGVHEVATIEDRSEGTRNADGTLRPAWQWPMTPEQAKAMQRKRDERVAQRSAAGDPTASGELY